MITITVLLAILALALILLGSSVRIITQYQRGVVFRFGRVLPETRGPGLALITPIADRLHKVTMQIITVVEVAAEKNSTLVLPFPVDLNPCEPTPPATPAPTHAQPSPAHPASRIAAAVALAVAER